MRTWPPKLVSIQPVASARASEGCCGVLAVMGRDEVDVTGFRGHGGSDHADVLVQAVEAQAAGEDLVDGRPTKTAPDGASAEAANAATPKPDARSDLNHNGDGAKITTTTTTNTITNVTASAIIIKTTTYDYDHEYVCGYVYYNDDD